MRRLRPTRRRNRNARAQDSLCSGPRPTLEPSHAILCRHPNDFAEHNKQQGDPAKFGKALAKTIRARVIHLDAASSLQ
jgi:hypothetical protein